MQNNTAIVNAKEVTSLVDALAAKLSITKQQPSKSGTGVLRTGLEDFRVLLEAFNKVIVRVEFLENENKSLKDKLNTQPPTAPALKQNQQTYNFSDVLKSGSKANTAILNAVHSDAKLQASKSRRVVIAGLPTAGDDTHKVSDLLNKLDIKSKFLLIGKPRLPKSSPAPESSACDSTVESAPAATPAPTPAAATSATASSATEKTQSFLVVELESTELRNALITAAKQLAKIDGYKTVFIRPDRTPTEQTSFNRLNAERKKLNDGLKFNNRLDQPFRFVIRGDRVRCIDVVAEKVQLLNGQHKQPFANWKDACKAAEAVVQNA